MGTIPRNLGTGLGNLVKLDLTQNKLVGSIPDTIGTLTSLVHLEIAENQLSGTIPKALANLVNLQYLSLGSNYVDPTTLLRLSYSVFSSNPILFHYLPLFAAYKVEFFVGHAGCFNFPSYDQTYILESWIQLTFWYIASGIGRHDFPGQPQFDEQQIHEPRFYFRKISGTQLFIF